MAELLSVQEAQNRILSSFVTVELISIALESGAGRILGEDIYASADSPHFANSSMDGFAVRAADLQAASPEKPVVLFVVAEIAAGSLPEVKILSGQAARIMTGAPIPDGADSVLQVESTRPGEPGLIAPTVLALRPTRPGESVRPRGQDIRQGQLILSRGRVLLPQDIGILASFGHSHLSVYRKPRLAIFSTGSEIILPGQPLQNGKIYDSNSYTLAALAEKAGAEVFRLGVAPDSLEEIRQLFDLAAAHQVDLILTSAGVSVGAFDYVRTLIESEGRMEFWRVNMRPGKPVAFGSYRGIPVIGLPGNPVSAYVGFEVFVRPVINRLAGLPDKKRRSVTVRLATAIESDGRETYMRGVLTRQGDQFSANLASHQGSGNLLSLVLANALLIVPSGVKSLPIGAEITAWLLVDEIE